MRSFRLDPDSVTEVLDSWPAYVIAPLLVCLFAYLGFTQHWGLVCAVLVCGVFSGYLLCGGITRRYRARYPGARWVWLLTVGQTSVVVGLATILALPYKLGTLFDMAWTGMAFFSILLFVLINRKNKDVVR